MIRENFKKVKLVTNKSNLGFSEANNIGAKEAQGKYLLFLNSDTLLLDNSIKEMIEFLDIDKKRGVVGGQLKNPDRSYQRSYAHFYNLLHVLILLFKGEKGELIRYVHDSEKKVDWVTGAFLMVRAELFRGIGGFDKQFFMYIEDMELCYRVRKMGYEVWYNPLFSIIHLGQGSSNRQFAVLQIYQGLLYFYKKHRSLLEYVLLRILLYTKAFISFMIGITSDDKYLKDTYLKALKI